jgi:hypothetical protein
VIGDTAQAIAKVMGTEIEIISDEHVFALKGVKWKD